MAVQHSGRIFTNLDAAQCAALPVNAAFANTALNSHTAHPSVFLVDIPSSNKNVVVRYNNDEHQMQHVTSNVQQPPSLWANATPTNAHQMYQTPSTSDQSYPTPILSSLSNIQQAHSFWENATTSVQQAHSYQTPNMQPAHQFWENASSEMMHSNDQEMNNSYHTPATSNVQQVCSSQKTDEETVDCQVCGKTFKKRENRDKHVNIFHSTHESNESAVERLSSDVCERGNVASFQPPTTFKCERCKFETIHRITFEKHSQKNGSCRQRFQCERCPSSFSQKKNLKSHEKKVHSVDNSVRKAKHRKCPECSFVSMDNLRDEIFEHFKTVHNVPIRCESHTFDDMVAFRKWKTEIEKATISSYKENGTAQKKAELFACSRNGYYTPKTERTKRMKWMGLTYVNSFCPAAIRIVKQPDGRVLVKYWPVHFGHKMEVQHIRLSKEEKKRIGEQILNQTPADAILAEAKRSLSTTSLSNMERIHLLSRRDLVNIRKSLKIDENIIKKNSVTKSYDQNWVEDFQTDNNTGVFYFKPKGKRSVDYTDLEKQDYLVIYMSNSQKSIMNAHGDNIIYLSSTYCQSSKYNLNLYTLIVVDNFREGYPAAFMLTNRSDESAMSIFFQIIREQCGVVAPNVFMSDVEDSVYPTWCYTMGPAKLAAMYSPVSVLKSWRRKMRKIRCKDARRRYNKRLSQEKRIQVMKIIRSLPYEIDKDDFHDLLDSILKDDDGMDKFNELIKKQFVDNECYKQWARCYLIDSGINPDISLEKFDKVVDHCYALVRKNGRLDEVLCSVLNFLKERVFKWYNQLALDRITNRKRIISLKHKESLLVSDTVWEKTGEDMWKVLGGQSGAKFFTVKKIEECCTDCQMVCDDCGACWHQYLCTCGDSALGHKMCAHIHLVAVSEKDASNACAERDAQKECADGDSGAYNVDVIIEEEMFSDCDGGDNNNGDDSMEGRFRRTVNKFASYCKKTGKSQEQMEYLEKIMHQAMTIAESMSTASHQ